MLVLDGFDFIILILRYISFFLDQIIYSFIPTVYNFIELLAKVYIFEPETLNGLAQNIYAIIGVFMLFRLGFVIITSIIDPDKLTNKDGGMAKMLSKLIIALVLIVAIPWAFDLAFRVQQAILDNQIIYKVILGEKEEMSDDPGQNLGRIALKSVFSCNEKVEGDVESGCEEELEAAFYEAFPKDSSQKGSFQYFWDHLTEQKTVGNNDEFVLDYTIGISTICGGFILYMVVIFAFSVASRVVKLAFLQIFTPVAVVGYVDPKGSIFNEWLKQVKNTYLNLFIRLAAIYFMVYIISVTSAVFGSGNLQLHKYNGELLSASEYSGATIKLIQIFIIFGALMFAKEAPKLISSMFGIKDSGAGGLLGNPLKAMIGGGLVGAAGGVAFGLGAKAVGTTTGAAVGGIASKKQGGSFWAGLGQGAKTGFQSIKLKDAAKGGIKGAGKTLSAGTIGAWGKSRDYAASKAAGKDMKVGALNAIKQKMAATAQEMHTGKSDLEFEAKGMQLREYIDNVSGKSGKDWDRQVNAGESFYQNAKRKASAVQIVFDNKEFGDAYVNNKLASAGVRDHKEQLALLQNRMNVANAEYQRNGTADNQRVFEELQEKVRLKNVDIAKYEETAALYKNEFEELKKKEYNKENVKKLTALEHYDDIQTAKTRIKPKSDDGFTGGLGI